MKIENVLVIAESSSTDEPLALRKALSLAQNRPIAIHLFSVVYSETEEHTTLLEDEARESLRQSLLDKTRENTEAIIKRECADAPNISHEIVWNKNLHNAVDNLCQQKEFDLIIKTGHRTESLLHVPTDFHLLRAPHTPAMILRHHGWASQAIVLATIDFAPQKPEQSELNKKVLSAAKQIADMSNAELHACYVVACSKVLLDLDFIHENRLMAKFKKKHEAELIKFAAEYDIAPGRLHLKAGLPEKMIPSIANSIKADLVVLGTPHRHKVSGLLVGHTSEKILHVLRTDVLTIKPE